MEAEYSIVTDGKRYRLQNKEKKFYEEYHCGVEGSGYFSLWQTRFYLRAVKKIAAIKQIQIRNLNEQREGHWVEV